MGNGLLNIGMVVFLMLFLGLPLAGIAFLKLIMDRGRFSLLSVLTAMSVIAILLGCLSYAMRN